MNRDNDKGKVLIRRSLIMALIKFLLLMVIIARLYYLQVYQADRYKTLADENRISTRLLVPPRGIIFDRNGVTIASNQQNFQALIVAEQAPNVQETLDAFKKIMPLSEAEEERIKKDLKRNRSFVPIKIRDNLSWEEVSRIQLNAPDLPGIVIDEGLTRYYPFGAGMAHILGYVSSVSDKDVKDDPFGEESGAAVLLDVHTGEILAFVSAPSFDPNMMTQGLSTEDWNALLHNERNPLTDKAISGQYSPGSTFKMIVALAALEAGVIKPETRTYCAGKMFLGNHAFHCWKKEGHGHLNVVEALQHSCDIFFYETAQKLGIEKIADMARRFGLGSKINIGLENEKAGLIPDKEWKLRRFGEPWQQGESLISGIGQGYILTTPLQLATMTARLVNGGYEIKPTFLKVSDGEKSKIRKIDVSPTNLELIKEGMYAVVNKPGGTAWRSQFDYHGQRMGGKTGTTQVRRITMKERREGIKKESELPWRLRNHALNTAAAVPRLRHRWPEKF